jgi:hypothetical protein
MEDSIKNINELTEDELILLKYLFNFIIPESNSLIIPGAAILLNTSNLFTTEFINIIYKSLTVIDLIIKDTTEKKWMSYSESKRIAVINEFKIKNIRIFNELSLHIVIFYYSNEIVLKSIDIKSIPPYPYGNSDLEGDLLLLESVFLRNILYKV